MYCSLSEVFLRFNPGESPEKTWTGANQKKKREKKKGDKYTLFIVVWANYILPTRGLKTNTLSTCGLFR